MTKYSSFDNRKLDNIPEFDFKSYDDEINLLLIICNKLDKKDETYQALKNYIIIRLVGIIENQFKSIIAELVDFFRIPPSDLLDSEYFNINVDNLDEIKSEEVTKGKIVVMNFSTQNAKDLSRIMSRINELDFFPWCQTILSITNPEIKQNNELFTYINNIFLLRNDVVHNLKNVELDKDWLSTAILTLNGFCRLSWEISALNLEFDGSSEMKIKIKKKINVDADTFLKITKEFEKKWKLNK